MSPRNLRYDKSSIVSARIWIYYGLLLCKTNKTNKLKTKQDKQTNKQNTQKTLLY